MRCRNRNSIYEHNGQHVESQQYHRMRKNQNLKFAARDKTPAQVVPLCKTVLKMALGLNLGQFYSFVGLLSIICSLSVKLLLSTRQTQITV